MAILQVYNNITSVVPQSTRGRVEYILCNPSRIKGTNYKHSGLISNTLMRSYSLMAQLLASSVTLMESFNSSNFRIRDLSPPNILEVAVSSFSALEFKEDNSEMRVCTVNKALDRSENAWCIPNIRLRCSCRIS